MCRKILISIQVILILYGLSASYATFVGDREENMEGWNSGREGSPAFFHAQFVPEPATLIFLCLGSLVLIFRRKQ